MKKNRSDIEIYLSAMENLQQEKASLSAALNAERELRRSERESSDEELRALREAVQDLTRQLRERDEKDAEREKRESSKDILITQLLEQQALLQRQLADAISSLKLNRGKRFSSSSERSGADGGSKKDTRADEKDDFDGNSPSASSGANARDAGKTDSEVDGDCPKKKKKKSAGRKRSLEDYGCDEVVRHTLDSYFALPEGGTFQTRNGQTEIHEYVTIEFVPGRIVKHVWETATWRDALGDAHNTLPGEERENPVKGCPFSAEMLAFILVEKYAYHTPKNRIKRKLREMGAVFAKSTFVKYYRNIIGALRKMLGDTFLKAAVACDYLMIDETSELVGVIDDETKIPQYRKRYLWAFHNVRDSLVAYVYEKGSRAREVVLKVLQGFRGTITTDGYSAYQIFDTDSHPDVLHCGCWAHVRRKLLEALGVATEQCRELLDDIGSLFAYEHSFKGLKPEDRGRKRKNLSRPLVNRIFDKAEAMAKDTALMGRELFRKAVSYICNQKETLRNFLKDGKAELSNNFCEQRMKPIKLDLKNCQNIGSEDAARDAAFMHSLVESCRMNNRNPYDYLLSLIRHLKKPLDDIGKRNLLPDRWVPEC